MVELRTVKQFREFLKDFSDDCRVMVNVNGIPMEISDYGWDAADDTPGFVESSMRKATMLDLYVEPNHETE